MTPSSKFALRREALARRDALSAHARASGAEAMARLLAGSDIEFGAGPVAGFHAIRSEIDPHPAMRGLAAAGLALALPCISADGLVFRAFAFGDALVSASFGLSEPLPSAPVVRPSALLVPLAAFDRRGHRIGYGKGYYDRAIAALSADGPLVTVGMAFSVQEIPAVPEEAHDRVLDWIVTDREVIRSQPV